MSTNEIENLQSKILTLEAEIEHLKSLHTHYIADYVKRLEYNQKLLSNLENTRLKQHREITNLKIARELDLELLAHRSTEVRKLETIIADINLRRN